MGATIGGNDRSALSVAGVRLTNDVKHGAHEDAIAKMQLDAKTCAGYPDRMSEALTPQIVRDRATAAHVSINHLMELASLTNSTFWRWEQGKIKVPHPVTLRKIEDALIVAEAKRVQDA